MAREGVASIRTVCALTKAGQANKANKGSDGDGDESRGREVHEETS